MTFHKDPKAFWKSQFSERRYSTQYFIALMRAFSKAYWIDEKQELFLFNPATFRLPEGEEEGLRRQENFVGRRPWFWTLTTEPCLQRPLKKSVIRPRLREATSPCPS